MKRTRRTDLLVLLGYAAVSFAYFGWRILPHPGRRVIGFGHDSEIYVWSFAWWPHAIAAGVNPLVTNVLYAPSGVNLAWTLTVPGVAFAFSPLTALVGPVVAYNIAALAMPAVSAWTAYLLCRYLTRSVWASLVGGYVFGFSAAMLRQQLYGHLPVTAVFVLPLIALVVVRYVDGGLTARGLVWRLGALLALQFWISTEYALTATIVLALALVLALLTMARARPRVLSALVPIVVSYALAAVFAAPLVYYALTGLVSRRFIDVHSTGSDLLNFVVPTKVIALGGSSFPSLVHRLGPAGSSAYLGLPTLLIAVLVALRARRVAAARFLVGALLITSVIALGTRLRVDGHALFVLPWRLATKLPVVANALPFRFTTYVTLVAAVLVAVWTATTRGRIYARPYLLPVLAVAAIVPSVWRSTYPTFAPWAHERVAFFTAGLYKSCLGPHETVAVFPFGLSGESLLWQAEAGFSFRVADDGLQAPDQGLTSFDSERIVYELTSMQNVRPTIDRLLAFAARHHVDRIISDPRGGYPNLSQMRRFGPVQLVGGLFVAPGCGRPSLVHRDLSRFVLADAHQQIGSAPGMGWCAGTNYYELPQGLYPVGLLRRSRPAFLVSGVGLTCVVPAGYRQHGFATPDMGVPANTYRYYTK